MRFGGIVNQSRVRIVKEVREETGPVACWMSRDQRVNDNWALLFAQEIALKQHMPLIVVFCLVPEFLHATIRQYGFMLRGLEGVEKNLTEKHIPFYLLTGFPEKEIPKFIETYRVKTLVTDFDPLRVKKAWKQSISNTIDIPFYEVDTHNIVPCWIASPKGEYGAYTIRPKIHRALKEFLEDFPVLKKHPVTWKEKTGNIDWKNIRKTLKVDHAVSGLEWIRPGEEEARLALRDFMEDRLSFYEKRRNDPNEHGQSNLSPYIHFGQLAPQRVALEVKKVAIHNESREAFLEELIVRRELSDNFCYYNPYYDSFDGFPDWAKRTLNEHRKDPRTYSYALEQFEFAETHDALWNAAQMEMVKSGKMHGYLRMYWAKKILEWTSSPEHALDIAIYLNNKHELDGRDPNGYAGIAWSIGGVHDRAWNERNIFGKIRYMSYNGCKSKFNVKRYIEHIQSL